MYQEHLLQQGIHEHEYLAYIGFWGSLIICVETFTIQLHEVEKVHTWAQILCILGFALATLFFYATIPFYIKAFGATMFNLSLIPTIVYSLLFSLVVYRSSVDWLYLCGYAVVLGGLCLYCLSRPPGSKQGDVTESLQVTLDEVQ